MGVTESEKWRATKYPGYEVSSAGRIRSWILGGRHAQSGRHAPLIISTVGSRGYRTFSPLSNGRRVNVYVHVAVLEAFHGPRPEGYVARHLNGDPLDNRASNLRWGTKAENRQDRIKHGQSNRGERNNTTKLTEAQVREIRARADESSTVLAEEFGVTRANIRLIIRRKSWGWLER